MQLILVAIGGAAGAVARYLVDGAISARTTSTFPWGTLLVNLSGSLLVGVLFALAIERDVLPAPIRWPLMVGFLGAYTTFSTLMLDAWRQAETGMPVLAIANLVGSSVLGLVAVGAGLVLGRALA